MPTRRGGRRGHITLMGRSLNRTLSTSDGTKRVLASKPRDGTWASDQSLDISKNGTMSQHARCRLENHLSYACFRRLSQIVAAGLPIRPL